MIEIQGRFNTAKVFADTLDEKARGQLSRVCDAEHFSQCKIRVMPDVHAGVGCVIGFTMALKDKVVPNMVGVDIGCGMYLCQLQEKEIDYAMLDSAIRSKVPSGNTNHKKPIEEAERFNFENLRCFEGINVINAKRCLGTLGGGNHFIEVDRDSDGTLYLVIHTGSRNLGAGVAEFYQKRGYQVLSQKLEEKYNVLLEKAKNEEEREKILREKEEEKASVLPHEAYVEGQLFEDYIQDMKITQEFADLNRKIIANRLIDALGLHVVESFTTTHNYIDMDEMVLRKGAVSAKKGEKLLIPINMRDGGLLCIGKGNEDWNNSAPHGAGRLMTRSKAKETISLEDYQKAMEGIYSTCISTGTLDESPMAYKNKGEIVKNIAPTAEIFKEIKPVYNFKSAK
ncbi:MAG: RtcB family protein [Clostridia bacterium]|nr:RtcB family protein [Clostridia bacterium]